VEPGFGTRHSAVAALLAESSPAEVAQVTWLDGTMPLRVSAYVGRRSLPDEFVTSIRCIVRVGDEVVICDTPDGADPWPGGRRETGESHWATAAREVYEETGWSLCPTQFRMLGWLHLECLSAMPADHPYPHPDFLQVVYTAKAEHREAEHEEGWVDLDGWVEFSRLLPIGEARAVVTAPCAGPFLDEINR
jgi:8-oxo-dGTP pyrophosphatase MutT (NUDIX family)